MRPTKAILLVAGCCLALLSACQHTVLPATTPPTETTLSPTVEENLIEETTPSPTPTSPPPPTDSTDITSPPTAEESQPTTPSPTTEAAITVPMSTESEPTESPSSQAKPTTATPPSSLAEPPTTTSPSSQAEPTTATPPSSQTEPTTTEPPHTQAEPVATEPPTEPASASPPPVLNRDRAEEAFCLQNQHLALHDAVSLQWSESLYQIAAQRVQEIATDYNHNGCPDWVAENILMGTNRPDLAVKIWYDSPGHQRNMLAGWTYGAIANYGFYWVAIYAMVECP